MQQGYLDHQLILKEHPAHVSQPPDRHTISFQTRRYTILRKLEPWSQFCAASLLHNRQKRIQHCLSRWRDCYLSAGKNKNENRIKRDLKHCGSPKSQLDSRKLYGTCFAPPVRHHRNIAAKWNVDFNWFLQPLFCFGNISSEAWLLLFRNIWTIRPRYLVSVCGTNQPRQLQRFHIAYFRTVYS